MILVTGATGTVSSEVMRELRAAGASVRALVRRPEAAEGLRAPGIEPALGDLRDAESLRGAVAGVDRIFLLSPPSLETLALERPLIDAARAAGVRHIVKLSVLGAGEPDLAFGRSQREAEAYLEASGVAFTHLRPGSFLQNVLDVPLRLRRAGLLLVPFRGALGLIDVRDIAAVAARALTEPGHEGRTYVLTGPRLVSYAEIAAAFSAVLGRKVRRVVIPWWLAALAAGRPAALGRALRELYDFYQSAEGARLTGVVEAVTGRPPRGLEEFARDYAPQFDGA